MTTTRELWTAPDEAEVWCEKCQNRERFKALKCEDFTLKEGLFIQQDCGFYLVPGSLRKKTITYQGTKDIALKCAMCNEPGTLNFSQIYPTRIKGTWEYPATN